VEVNLCRFCLSIVYICIADGDTIHVYCRWRSSTRGEGWNTLATFLCLSQARNWISNVICYVFFGFNCLRLELNVNLVDIGGIVDHHYLNFQYHYRMLLKCVTPVHTYLTLVLLSTWFFTLSSPSFCNLP